MNSGTGLETGAASQKLADILREEDYLRQRLRPDPRDIECLVHEDLRDVILFLCQSIKGRLLDYGCGGSPYASLLPQFSPYVRADISPGEGIDLVTDSRGLLPDQPTASYDVVFSTQVLEHVPEPAKYLAEAFRLVRPGGSLVLTTHGFFPEHGCPDDYYRWTGYGLKRVVEDAGFVVEENYKYTTALRAAIYWLHIVIFGNLYLPHDKWQTFLRRVRRFSINYFLSPPLNRWGRTAKDYALVSNHLNWGSLYIGVALRARKPASPAEKVS